jgi:AraC-like DNA-binding protein
MYRERSSSLAGAVVWWHAPPAGEDIRVLPDACMDLMWNGQELIVAGPDTVAHVAPGPAASRHVGLRFAPGTGATVLGVPASELRDRRIPLADLWPAAQVRRLAGRVAAAADPGAALEAVARDRARHPDLALAAIVAGLRGGASVARTASALGYGPRRLHRRCLDAFGYGPKTLARILRMNRALELARAGTPFAAVAASAGYADQAHLAREVKALAGVTLGVLVN